MTRPSTPKPHEPKPNRFPPSRELEIFSALTYGSYHANRGYGMSAETYAKMMNWDSYTAQAYENAYQANMEQQREDERYKRLMRDLDLLEDGNFTNQ